VFTLMAEDVFGITATMQSELADECTVVETPDIAAVADAHGATGYTVRSVDGVDDLRKRVAAGLDSPVVVDREVRYRFYGTDHMY